MSPTRNVPVVLGLWSRLLHILSGGHREGPGVRARSGGARSSLLGPVSPLPKRLVEQVEAGAAWVAEGSPLLFSPPVCGPSEPLPVPGKVSVDLGSCHQPGTQGPTCWLLKGWVGLGPHSS